MPTAEPIVVEPSRSGWRVIGLKSVWRLEMYGLYARFPYGTEGTREYLERVGTLDEVRAQLAEEMAFTLEGEREGVEIDEEYLVEYRVGRLSAREDVEYLQVLYL